MKLNFDPRCYSLAEIFLDGEDASESDIIELAQSIQDTVEHWIESWQEDRAKAPEESVP